MPGGERGWKSLPNAVARDARLSDAELVVLAFRVTRVGRYGLNEIQLGKICKADDRGHTGLGKNSARRIISRLVELKYLSRTQPKASGGVYAHAVDRLLLADCDQDYRRVYREWFDGTWSLEEIAAFIVLRAGLLVKGRGGGMIKLDLLSADDLRKRFGWSREKTLAALKDLQARGRIEQKDLRDKGAYRGTRYQAVPWAALAAGNGDSGQRMTGQRVDERLTYDSNMQIESDINTESLPSEDFTRKNTYTSSPSEGGSVLDLNELDDHCFGHDPLLGWTSDIQNDTAAELANIRHALGSFSGDALEAVLNAANLDTLATRVMEAAGGRVAPPLRGRAGAYCVAYMASYLLTEQGVAAAVDEVLEVVRSSIGSRQTHWLNSYRLIGIHVLRHVS